MWLFIHAGIKVEHTILVNHVSKSGPRNINHLFYHNVKRWTFKYHVMFHLKISYIGINGKHLQWKLIRWNATTSHHDSWRIPSAKVAPPATQQSYIDHDVISILLHNSYHVTTLSVMFFISWQPIPDSKVHGAHMGPTWGQQDPGGPHVGPMKIAIWDQFLCYWGVYSLGVIM